MEGLFRCSDVLEPRYGMDLDWQHYHRLNVTLLSVIGLWPFDKKLDLRLKRCVGGFFALFCCFSQLATFVTVDYTKELLLRNVPLMFVGCGILLKYISFLAASDSIKRVTKTIDGDWKDLSSKEEIEIIEKYVERGKFHTKGFAMFIFPVGIPLLLLPLHPMFLDILVPLNESRNRNFPIMFEMFLDQKKHFFTATFLFDGGLTMGALVFVSTETLFIVYIQHACALFEVTSCRIRRLFRATGGRGGRKSSNALAIAQVVEIHSKAIRYCVTIREDFMPSYIILLAFGILSLAAHSLRCIQTFATHEFKEFLPSAMFCLAILGYMFYLNFVVQNLLDCSAKMFHVLYETEWCDFSSPTRKLVLFCMLRSMKPIAIDVCSLYHPSYEGFSMIVRMTMSYATALYSFQ